MPPKFDSHLFYAVHLCNVQTFVRFLHSVLRHQAIFLGCCRGGCQPSFSLPLQRRAASATAPFNRCCGDVCISLCSEANVSFNRLIHTNTCWSSKVFCEGSVGNPCARSVAAVYTDSLLSLALRILCSRSQRLPSSYSNPYPNALCACLFSESCTDSEGTSASLAAKGPSSQCLLQSHSHHSVSTSESDTLVTLMEGRAFCWDENDPPAKAFDVQAFSDLLAHRTLRSIL